MKQSIFNSRINITKSTDLLYNAFSDTYMLLRNNVPVTTDHNSRNYESFVKGGFIINDNIDEIECVKKMSQEEDLRNDVFMLIVNTTLNCNLTCWYCYEQKSLTSEIKEETLSRIKSLTANICADFKKLHLSFFGGEPLLKFSKTVKPLIEYAESKSNETGCKLYISFTTNGTLLTPNVISYIKNKEVHFQITVDGDRLSHNKTRCFKNGKGSYDIILKNIFKLLRDHHSVTIRINYTDENIDSAINLINDIKRNTNETDRNHLRIALHQVWQNTSMDLTEQVEKLKNDFLAAGIKTSLPLFDNVRSSCYGDKKNSVVVNYNGDLFKCTAIDFMNTKRDGYLDHEGNLIWENGSLNKRLNVKFTNEPCLKCRILPICNGGCSQKHLYNNGKDFCVFDFSEKKKDKVILEKFDNYITETNR